MSAVIVFYVAYRRELSSRFISSALSECISTTLVLQHKLHSSEFSQEENGNRVIRYVEENSHSISHYSTSLPASRRSLKVTLTHLFQQLIRTKLNCSIRCHSHNINKCTTIKPLNSILGICLSKTIKVSIEMFRCSFTTL